MRVWIVSWPLILVGLAIGMIAVVFLAVVCIAVALVALIVLVVRGCTRLVRRSPRARTGA
jgi:type IV secretory pathway VirB3-like protein